MHARTNRRALLSLAGVTSGLAALLAPTGAYAAPAEQRGAPTPVTPQPVAAEGDVTLAASVCNSWTDYTTGTGYTVAIPSTTRNGNQADCILAQGHATDGVYKLQDALIRCYGRGIAKDGVYGSQTASAVRYVQQFHRITADGIYGQNTRAAMRWPKYRNGAFNHC